MTSDRADRVDWRLYVILDPEQLHPGFGLMETAEAVLSGGAGVIQLRDKDATGRALVGKAKRLQSLADRNDATFIVNDRIDVALAAGADGVHLGPEDVPVREARSVAPDLLIGGSAGEVEPATELQRKGVDYIGCGAIYDAGTSKPDASAPRGPQAVADVVAAIDVPVVGIGGITPENAADVVKAGASGVAVIRSVVSQPDPERAARRLFDVVAC